MNNHGKNSHPKQNLQFTSKWLRRRFFNTNAVARIDQNSKWARRV